MLETQIMEIYVIQGCTDSLVFQGECYHVVDKMIRIQCLNQLLHLVSPLMKVGAYKMFRLHIAVPNSKTESQ